MSIQNNFQAILSVTTLLLLSACATSMAPANPTGNALPETSNAATRYGVVQSIEKSQPSAPTTNAYTFTLRMSDGSYQSFTQTTNVDIRVGDRVQVDNAQLRRY
jgi:outer membrane lipoprotein SlyB